MSAKATYETDAKRILHEQLKTVGNDLNIALPKFVDIESNTDLDSLPDQHPWLSATKLVVKPDQMIKRRGKLGLLRVNADWKEVCLWVNEHRDREISIGKAKGMLKHFIVEPFVAHRADEELYLAIYSHRDGDTILFHHEGGVDIGDVDAKAASLEIAVNTTPSADDIKSRLLANVTDSKHRDRLARFLLALYKVYVDLNFTYLEINPLVLTHDDGRIYVLDLAAKLDQAAEYLVKSKWGDVRFPAPFGREASAEEAYIADLDAKSGASLKLTVINKSGRVWTMVAGGGSSVIYADTICDFGFTHELANYGEYSGAPSETQTYEYAKTILGLMTDGPPNPRGKVLIIGGSIANFTNVAATFKGIVRALTEYKQKLIEHKVSVYVRRGGPNYQEGLRYVKEMGLTINIPTFVFGPETHMTAVVAYALGLREIPEPDAPTTMTANFLIEVGGSDPTKSPIKSATSFLRSSSQMPPQPVESTGGPKGDESTAKPNSTLLEAEKVVANAVNGVKTALFSGIHAVAQQLNLESTAGGDSTDSGRGSGMDYTKPLFTSSTKCIIWGMQPRAAQSMLDFDFVCSRKEPSVVCMVYPLVGDHKQKFYWGHKEILMSIYKDMAVAMRKHPEADCVVNFASLRSAYESTMEVMQFPQIRSIAIIAEGIPENLTRQIIRTAHEKKVTIIGPATVGGIKPGCFKIGNTGGMLDNILASKLYRPGSVAYVSRSGGMSNELNNIISRTTNGVYEGVAIGGDRYPASTFLDHILRYEADANVKLIVMLGELGGVEEYHVIEAMRSGQVTKPIIAWCIGTCASMFSTDVQFGHAGAAANSERETADAKNRALAEAGATVPRNFDELGDSIQAVYERLCRTGVIVPLKDAPPPTVPMDYAWARELGLIRKPASFMTSICDERGQELLYAGVPITDIMKEDLGIGGVLSLLWFQRRLPRYATKFFEMCLMVTADHGPAVSGAHNTIVTARAGKDLVSSLTSGLLTIGDRFGGALDGAARQFSDAYDSGLTPDDMVNTTRKEGKLIMGIGHRVKSINNPDKRVEILKQYIHQNFAATPMLDYALAVEKITTRKKPNLILNIDGLIATAFVDLLRHSGCFNLDEAKEYLDIGVLNGLFVVGRSIGFIGHYLDQRRLKQGLYRHPWDDISYIMPELSTEAQTGGRSAG